MILLAVACVPGAVLRDVEIQVGGIADFPVAVVEAEVVFERFELTLLDLRLHEPTAMATLGLPGISPLGALPARAHPGHDGAGDVRGELLGSFRVDLLAAPTSLGDAQVYSGEIDSISLGVGEAALAGEVRRGEERLPFDLALDLGGERVEGIGLGLDLPAEGPAPRLVLRGDPAAFVKSALLASAEDSDGDGRLSLGDKSLENRVAFGLRSTTIWTAEAVEGG